MTAGTVPGQADEVLGGGGPVLFDQKSEIVVGAAGTGAPGGATLDGRVVVIG